MDSSSLLQDASDGFYMKSSLALFQRRSNSFLPSEHHWEEDCGTSEIVQDFLVLVLCHTTPNICQVDGSSAAASAEFL